MSNTKQKQPNILVIWGNDIGITNLSCYSHGLMGYQTTFKTKNEGKLHHILDSL